MKTPGWRGCLRRSRFLVALLGALFVAAPAAAQKVLSWDALRVRATLDAEGTLHVTERHEMEFTGDWNGGERTFRVAPSQELQVESMSRIDASGAGHPMQRGNLSEVDHWDMDRTRLRWRARQPSDPAFDHTKLTYEIHYSLARVLVPQLVSGGYRLAHDFAFPDRSGSIAEFELHLGFAPEWNHNPIDTKKRDIPSGDGFVVKVDLRSAGVTRVNAESAAASLGRRFGGWLAVIPAGILLALFFAGELRQIREVKTERAAINAAWVEQHVIRLAPEVAGALLDGNVGAGEVAAMLSKMELDGKLKSEMVKGPHGYPELELELLVPVDDLPGRERMLARELFGDARRVNTRAMREAHALTGFDLPAAIRESVRIEVEALAPGSTPGIHVRNIALFIGAGVILFITGIVHRPADILMIFLVAFGSIGAVLLGLGAASSWRRERRVRSAVRLLLPGVMMMLLAEACQRVMVPTDEPSGRFTLYTSLALGCFLAAIYRAILDKARDGLSLEGVRIREQMADAREWMRLQLQQERPSIPDGWTPWMIAFGLQDSVERWFKSYGAARPQRSATSDESLASPTWSTSGSSDDRSSTPVFTGGGGRFGGAGATGSWAAAATEFASPISAARSYSSSSGSSSSESSWSSSSDSSWSSSSDSSSSSSGGGGGGGW